MRQVLRNRKLVKLIAGILIICLCSTIVPDIRVQAEPHADQWYLGAINALEAREIAENIVLSKVQVAVLDSGLNMEHQEFQGIVNKSLAWDVVRDTVLTGDFLNVANSGGHGTKVTGVLAGNGVAMESVAGTNVELIPVNVVDNRDLSMMRQLHLMIKGFQYIEQISQEAKTENLRVISLSNSLPIESLRQETEETGEDYEALVEQLETIIERLRNQYGILTVAAGGNIVFNANKGPTDFIVPSDFESVLSVTATNKKNNNVIGFCYNDKKDISAPGIDIFTTIYKEQVINGKTVSVNDCYTTNDSGGEYLSGTSFATPLTAGAAGLIWAINPDLSVEEVVDIIKTTAQPGPDKEFVNRSNGLEYQSVNGSAGLLDVKAAVEETIKRSTNIQYKSDSQISGGKTNEQNTSIPKKYDGREYGYLTPVRDQKGSNMCWAYATMACLEADAVKNNGFPTDLDLSEYQLAYYTFNNKKDALGLTNSDEVSFYNLSDENNFITNGASLSYAVSTLSSGVGPVLESDAPLSQLLDSNGFTIRTGAYTNQLPEELRRDRNVLTIESIYAYSLFNKSEYDRIKQGIMEHGAAAISYYSQPSTGGYSKTDLGVAYYQNEHCDPDHGVAIVGWDDEFPISAFAPDHQPKNPGAWLVRNSWGSIGDSQNYTVDGYFWLSYEDTSLTSLTSEGKGSYAYVYDVCPATNNRYKYTYQYDGGIIHEYSATTTEQQAEGYANIFTAQKDERLDAITVHTDRGSANARFTLSVYKDVTTEPVNGKLVHKQNVTIPVNGFFTIPLTESVELSRGQKYSIVLMNAGDWWESTFICTDRDYDRGDSAFKSINNTAPYQSFIYNGSSWKDLHYDRFYTNEDGVSVCIKALTNDIDSDTNSGNTSASQTARIIYTSNTNGNNNTGNGTESNPYNLLSNAISNSKDGDTIVVKGTGYVNELGTSSPLVIDKAITIKGEGTNTFPIVTLRTAGIILGKDVTLENLEISFANTDRNAIIANGYNLTLNGIKYCHKRDGAKVLEEAATQAINLFCGGIANYQGSVAIPVRGSHGNIVIKNGYSLQTGTAKANIYAGNILDSAVGATEDMKAFSGDATVIVEDMNSNNYLGDFYAHGALRTNPLGVDLSGEKVEPPIANTSCTVAGNVTVQLNYTAIKNVYGDQGNGKYAEVIYHDTSAFQSKVDDIYLEKVGDLSVTQGYMIATAGSSFGKTSPTVSVSLGARLGLNGFGSDITAGDFNGGGGLVLDKNQHLTISGQVTGSTQLGIGGMSNSYMNYSSDEAMQVGQTYIIALNSNSDSFKITPKSGDTSVLAYDSTDGSWTAKNNSSSSGENTKLKGITFYDGVLDDEHKLPALNGLIRKKTNNFGITLEAIPDAEPSDGFISLATVPFSISVTTDEGGMVTATRKRDDEGCYTYTVGYSLRLEFGYQEFNICGYEGLDTTVPAGVYKIVITIPKDYSATNYSYTRSFTVIVDAESASTPTPSPTLTPSPTVIPTPTPSPTLNPEPTPTPSPEGVWISGISEDGYTYTGKTITIPELKVFWGGRMLEEKKDYTVSYKNNTKAWLKDDYGYNQTTDANGIYTKAPTVIIKGIGNFGETRPINFEIKPLSIEDPKECVIDDIAVVANNKKQRLVPVATYAGKKLKYNANGTGDYKLDYVDDPYNTDADSYKEPDVYEIKVIGTGNYTGERIVNEVITSNKLLSKATIKLVPNQNLSYTGNRITPEFTVMMGKVPLSKDEDYTIRYEKNEEVGTAAAVFTGIGSYAGTKRVSYKITGENLSKATAGKISDKTYTGKPIELTEAEIKAINLTNNGIKVNRDDYEVSYSKNTNPGAATLVLTGKGKYAGSSKKISFKIVKCPIANSGIEVSKEAEYTKSGAKPEVNLRRGVELVEGKDYKLSYKNNTSVQKEATVTITGIGGYSGSISYSYRVTAKDMGAEDVQVAAVDKVYQNKKNIYKTTITVTDNGKKLGSSDYDTKTIKYTYEDNGREVDPDKVIGPGTRIKVEVSAKEGSNYTGKAEGYYRITECSLSKVSVKGKINKTYTGKEIELSKADFDNLTITYKVDKYTTDTLKYGTDYYIVPGSYVSNIKKGTGKVTIRGNGSYGGTKVITFTIGAKSIK